MTADLIRRLVAYDAALAEAAGEEPGRITLVEDHGLPLIATAADPGVTPRSIDRASFALAADPLTTDGELPLAQTCRVCGCTDYASCDGGCSWIVDPVGLGPLCSRCLEIAVAVTSQDPEAMATYDPGNRRPRLSVAPGPVSDYHDAGLPGAILGLAAAAAIVGLVVGIGIGILVS